MITQFKLFETKEEMTDEEFAQKWVERIKTSEDFHEPWKPTPPLPDGAMTKKRN
jgi:hypothetical protein